MNIVSYLQVFGSLAEVTFTE